MARQSPENDPALEPAFVAEWNNSRAEVYNYEELFAPDAADGHVLLQESDFDIPIRRLTVTSQRLKTAGAQAEPATIYNAEIDMDQLLPGEWETFFSRIHRPNSDFTIISDQTWLQEDDKVKGSYHLVHAGKAVVTVMISENMPHVRVHNMPDDEIEIVADNTTESEESLLYFLNTMMRTVDYIAGFRQPKPSEYKLERTYMIARELVPITTGSSTVPKVGSLAIEGPPVHHASELLNENKTGFKDVGGNKGIKAKLQELVMARLHPEIMQKWGAEVPSGVLLFGPTGNGKTMLINALANELNAKLIEVKGSQIIDMWVGNSEKNLEAVFKKAHNTKGNAVLFFDEFETIIGGTGDGERISIGGAFKRLSAMLPQQSPHVLLAAATNHIDIIDPALIASSRFDLKLSIGNPDEESRADIIASFLDLGSDLMDVIASELEAQMPKHSVKEFRTFDGDLDLLKLAQLTDGFNGAAIKTIFQNLRRNKAMQEAAGLAAIPINQQDIEHEILAMKQAGQIS